VLSMVLAAAAFGFYAVQWRSRLAQLDAELREVAALVARLMPMELDEEADLATAANGALEDIVVPGRPLAVFDAAGARLEPLPPPTVPRVEVIDALERAIASGVPALHDGRWARATLEVCAALLESARTGVEVALHQQVSVR